MISSATIEPQFGPVWVCPKTNTFVFLSFVNPLPERHCSFAVHCLGFADLIPSRPVTPLSTPDLEEEVVDTN